MRVRDGVIYLDKPLFGRQILTGAMIVMTTWIDYTFPEKLTAAELGLQNNEMPPTKVRVLIPLDNVVAVVAECYPTNEPVVDSTKAQYIALESI